MVETTNSEQGWGHQWDEPNKEGKKMFPRLQDKESCKRELIYSYEQSCEIDISIPALRMTVLSPWVLTDQWSGKAGMGF